MHVVLWDTRQLDVAKDFAGGFGVGQYHGFGGFRGRVIRWAYKRDRRPVALNYAYLAAIFRKLGHTVQYSEDRVPAGGDVYVFNPSLITLHLEIAAIHEVLAKNPQAKILIVGLVAYALPEAFDGLNVTIVRGEPERLLWKLDDVLSATTARSTWGACESSIICRFPTGRCSGRRGFASLTTLRSFPPAWCSRAGAARLPATIAPTSSSRTPRVFARRRASSRSCVTESRRTAFARSNFATRCLGWTASASCGLRS